MVYRVKLTGQAQKELARLPREMQARIARAIDGLKTTPRPSGSRAVKGHAGSYRLRVGDYRVLYEVNDGELLITVWRIQHRKDVYRDLN